MDWRRLVRGSHQVPAEANRLRRWADDEPVEPAAVQGMRIEPDTVMGEWGGTQEKTLARGDEGTAMGTEQLLGELHRFRTRAARFHAGAVSRAEPPRIVLDEALTELAAALEELRVTEAELRAQNERLVAGFVGAQADHDRLEDRFLGAPDACLETDTNGVILAANATAGALLKGAPLRLIGKPLAGYVAVEDRRAFRTRLRGLVGADSAVQRWKFRVRGRTGVVREVDARLRIVPPAAGRGWLVWWSLTPTDEPVVDLSAERPSADAETVVSALGSDAEAVLRQLNALAISLFRAAGAGVMLADENGVPRWVAASDARAQAFEHAQAALGQGPCVDALHITGVVSTPDVATDARWPKLGALVAGQGIGGVLCVPLVLGEKPIGSFNAFASGPMAWTAEDESMVARVAAMVALLLQTRVDLREQQALATQLQQALHARVVIEQAKGVLIARRAVNSDQAWMMLREAARAAQRRAADLAATVVQTGDLPTPSCPDQPTPRRDPGIPLRRADHAPSTQATHR